MASGISIFEMHICKHIKYLIFACLSSSGAETFKTNTKSAQVRSSDRVCCDLVRVLSLESPRILPRDCVRGCCGFGSEILPKGMCIRGRQFSYRAMLRRRARSAAGLSIDEALLRPFADDPSQWSALAANGVSKAGRPLTTRRPFSADRARKIFNAPSTEDVLMVGRISPTV